MFFKSKKIEPKKEDNTLNQDLAIITQMNQEFATSLDLNETMQTALEVIIKRLNAQAANIFLIEDKKQVFQCIASKYQSYLDEYEIPLTQGVMGKAVLQKKCIRVGDVRKDVREIAEFYFDLDNKTNFTTYSVLCSPLIAANECIGVIHCLNKKTSAKLFEENDRKLLETLSAPAALVVAKIIYPETEESQTMGDINVNIEQTNINAMEALSNGATDGLKLAANIAAMLIAFISFVAMVNYFLSFAGTSMEDIFGIIFRPLAWTMGVPWNEAQIVGMLMGKKIVLTELVAYGDLQNLIRDGMISERSAIISTYALCGFSNLASIGLQLGGIGAMAPDRKKDLAKLVTKAMFGGAIASCLLYTSDAADE